MSRSACEDSVASQESQKRGTEHPSGAPSEPTRCAGVEVPQHLELQHRLSRCEDANAALALTLLHLQEDERGRIARELHDGIGQSLSGAAFRLDRAVSVLASGIHAADAATPDVRRQIVAVSEQIRATVNEVRRICNGLRPAILDDLGIVAALAWLGRDFRDTHDDIRLTLDLIVEEDRVPTVLKTEIFRIVQESLNNVAKHARATEVFVGLCEVGHDLLLTISDNGCGTKTADLAAHMAQRGCCGVASMRKRVDVTGGSFSFNSNKGGGTTVGVCWSLRPQPSRRPRVTAKAVSDAVL